MSEKDPPCTFTHPTKLRCACGIILYSLTFQVFDIIQQNLLLAESLWIELQNNVNLRRENEDKYL